ncbi:DNA topoisomerase IV subunit A [Isobaculum melis]|uniref:DNA topoisomerase 4 subunit A n=1 Tax=Isobaculum melis TaxID=142588 RepID=A0A1H9SYT3_9LACT|nr:DNA topoisomerase IV subunit A [Isobaculum melis]SER90105.1 DNA topoisomerase IV subunit A [Isobaculum melis]
MDPNRVDVQELTLEEVMGDRFGRYSKYIIQERALPDIRDGLKPVQRRILYAMNMEGNTAEKGFRKSAKTVGNVIGNYHPHGDTSVYEAMVRMSQDWKLRNVLVEMHGNNGSMDGDPPAAMRYTEARLSKIASEMLKDIDKETVDFVLNFDDTEEEPTVLPAKFPNLLVNGATGISAGYATDIPPHNLGEVIDATTHLLDHPDATFEDLMKFIKGPDFPTGGILQGLDGIKQAYATGKGKVIVRSKTHIEDLRGGKQQIIVTEVPYEVNKSVLVKKLDEVRLNKRIEGIAEVRDESDRTGLQIAIELKKEANAAGILNYLLKNTDLQVAYNFNMIAIDDKRPKLIGIVRFLSAYIDHQKQVITRRSIYNLKKAEARAHIVEGLIKALSILDKVIATIRESKDKKNAKENLMESFDFTEKQAEAIVSLQLYRLTNTDITALEAESAELKALISSLKEILNSDAVMVDVIKSELKEVKKQFKTPRLTVIENEIEELKIETEVLVVQEDVMVSVTSDGYLKRSSLRSYGASKPEEIGAKEGDYPIFIQQMNTMHHLLMFTNKGNYIYRPVHEIPDLKWKDMGEHISQTIGLDMDERIIKVIGLEKYLPEANFVFVTKAGMVKRTLVTEYLPTRYISKSAKAMKLKSDDDVLLNIWYVEQPENMEIFLSTYLAYGLRYDLSEVPVVGSKAAGVKAISLKADDHVISGIVVPKDEKASVMILTQRGSVKKMAIHDFDKQSRAKRGLMILRELKRNPHRVFYMDLVTGKHQLLVQTDKEKEFTINSADYSVSDRYSNGSFILDEQEDGRPHQVLKSLEQLN